MEIKGRIVQVLPLQSGVGQSSGKEWKRQEYVLETQDQYPRKVCFQLSGSRIEQYSVAEGDEVTVSFDLESREFRGRWYTDVRAWKIEKGAGASVPPTTPTPDTDLLPPPPPASAEDDLPF